MGRVRRQVLWSAGIAPTSLAERIEAAAVNGYEILSIMPTDYEQVRAEGREPAELKRLATDRGVDLAVLDGLIEWHPHDPPKRPLGNSDFSVDDVLRIGEAFGVSSINALAPYPTSLSMDDLAGCFAALCDRAAEQGLRVHFEFTPRSPVSDVSTAAELIGLANRANGGILFDTWHFFRVNPELHKLRRVPGERIFAVQISDGTAGFEEGLLADTFRHRRLPGEGVFDLRGALAALDAIGGLRLVGPEVLAVELFALPAAEAARRAAESLDRLLADFAATTAS
jgi:sugar phosphate isomerase/epimerase